MRHFWALLGAAALALLMPLAPAAAATEHHPARASFVLTLTDEHGVTDAVTLRCRPTGGTHPDRWLACRELALVDGDFDALPPTGQPCTDEYHPVTARAWGHWDGDFTVWEEWFSNPCMAAEETSGVFRF